jgi:hypothetical protein
MVLKGIHGKIRGPLPDGGGVREADVALNETSLGAAFLSSEFGEKGTSIELTRSYEFIAPLPVRAYAAPKGGWLVPLGSRTADDLTVDDPTADDLPFMNDEEIPHCKIYLLDGIVWAVHARVALPWEMRKWLALDCQSSMLVPLTEFERWLVRSLDEQTIPNPALRRAASEWHSGRGLEYHRRILAKARERLRDFGLIPARADSETRLLKDERQPVSVRILI